MYMCVSLVLCFSCLSFSAPLFLFLPAIQAAIRQSTHAFNWYEFHSTPWVQEMSYFCIFLNQVKSHSKPPLVRVARTLVSIILHLSTNNNSGTLLNLPGRQKMGVGRGSVILWKRGLAFPFLSTDLMGWSWRTRERHMALGFSHEHWVEPERCLSNPYVSAMSLCFFFVLF